MRTAVIGGGISGLSTAFLLKAKGFDVKLFEKNPSTGGNIKTEIINGYLVEHGPTSTLETTPLLNKLFEQLGLLQRKIYASDKAGKRYILKNGKLYALPMNPIAFLKTGLFPASAKFRLLKEPFISSKSNETETIAEFTKRRLGQHFLDYAINPFVAGVFAGNPDELNVKSAFPKLYELEQKHGSLIGGAIRSRKERNKRGEESKQSAKTISFINGLSELVDAINIRIKDSISVSTELTELKKTGNGFELTYSESGSSRSEAFEAVVLSVPALAASRLIKGFSGSIASELERIYYPPVSVVVTGFNNKSLKTIPDGFGFLVPGKENRKLLGSLWNSIIFPGRAPEGYSLMTNYIGGSRQPELAAESDGSLTEIVLSELNDIIGLNAEPDFVKIIRWEKAIPQYSRGHALLTDKLNNLQNEIPGLFICSNYFKGISVCDCIKNSFETTDKIIDFMNSVTSDLRKEVYV